MTNLKPKESLRELRQKMTQYFNMDELQAMAFDLSLDWEEITGTSKSIKAQSMVIALAQRGRLNDLYKILRAERPDVDWSVIPINDFPPP